jgi:hypothetical protein
MNALILVSAAVILACPTAIGQPLKVPNILHHIEGVWAWTGRDGIGTKHSCAGEPMRIWLEDSGRVYKSQQVTSGLVSESKVSVQPGKPAADQTFIMIKHLNCPQRDMFGRQVVWSLSMPDHDHFVWRQLPLGQNMPPLERCDAKKYVG